MINVTQPRYVMPMHGDFRRLQLHGQLAESLGIHPEDIFRGRRTACRSRSTTRGARFGEAEQAGLIFVDGVDLGDPEDIALRDRRMLVGRRHLHRRRDDLRAGRHARSRRPS